ncbi:putative 3-hydroxyacyl-CoA dehydrogenase NAD-binding protein [Syntrophobacter sp. SbD1]|nr:putative 3-hydroxyacyl-CoA dehydrogenase NAD-binding protein [Syntrophobacter sp. SbD1]
MAMIYLKEFPDDLHHRMKVQAALEKTTMKDLIIRLVEKYLEEADQRKEG